MVRDVRNWRIKDTHGLTVAALPLFAVSQVSPVQAQSIMRTPSLHIDSRVPTINPTVAPRINPSIAGRSSVTVNTIARTPPTTDHARCAARGHTIDAPLRALFAQPLSGVRLCLSRQRRRMFRSSRRRTAAARQRCCRPKRATAVARNNAPQTAINLRSVPNELVAEIDGALTDAQADELARRHGLTRLQSQNFPLLGATIGLFRITDRRSVETVRRELAGDGSVRSVQLNFRYVLQDQKAASTEGDPAQYALAQLRLPQAHTLARGMNVTVAVIDSGIDASHPELGEFDRRQL